MNAKNMLKLAVFPLILTAVACTANKQETAPAAPETPAQTSAVKETNNMQALLDPQSANLTAPAAFKVKFKTTKGDFTVEVTRAWAPLGADRFYNLVKIGYFSDMAFFRVVDGFMVQFGIHGDPAVNAKWRGARIQDDPVTQSNNTGYVTYAMAGPNTRTTQLFINFGNNAGLDSQGFSPFGKVSEGMNVVESIYSGYGDAAPRGMGPDQGRAQMEGNAYLKKDFPKMDFILSAAVE